MKLTKRRALEICRDLWKWLEKHPDKKKCDWPGWPAAEKEDGGKFLLECPCCEYVRQTGDLYRCARTCPLQSLWPEGCERSAESPWNEWVASRYHEDRYHEGRTDALKGAARKIRQAAEKELEKLRGDD